MRRLFFIVILFSSFNIAAQVDAEQKKLPPPMIERDSLYREDQFYAGFNFNLLLDTPDGLTQNKFSSGFHGGFVRDMPFNKSRTKAVGVGIGVTYNKYFQNLMIYKNSDGPQYNIIGPGVQFIKNKFDEILVDVPVEYRWRTSTPESHKFWRVYSGIKLSYVVAAKARFVDATSNIRVSDSQDVNRFQAGAYIVGGYNTWNVYAYYGLTPLFKSSAKVNNEKVGFKALSIGLIFYIL